jgi:hypothetical protein
MKRSTALKPVAESPTRQEGHFRTARALIGWLDPNAAHQLLVCGRDDQAVSPEVVARARSAREFAAARTPIEQSGVLGQPPTGIGEHLALLRQHAPNLFEEGFRICTVELGRLYAIQPTTFTDYYLAAVSALDPGDVRAIAEVTLPHAVEVQLAVVPDPARRTITLSCPNLNLQLLGPLEPQMSPNGCAVGFQTTVSNSLLQVAHMDGRFFCRDGHTRALQLLRRGIERVPALVKEFASYADVAPRSNPLDEVIALGANPPTLQDFLDDRVAADVLLPMIRKAIVISASEIEIPV